MSTLLRVQEALLHKAWALICFVWKVVLTCAYRLACELNMCFNVLYALLNTIQKIAIREANRYKVHQKAF